MSQADLRRRIRADIKRVGWSGIHVAADVSTPCFSYTVGLRQSFGIPEVIIVGMPPVVAHSYLAGVVEMQGRNGQALPLGLSKGYFGKYDGWVVNVAPESFSKWLVLAADMHPSGHWFALQLVWPDRDGRFPWTEGSRVADQPVLGEVCPEQRLH